jgi:hypothetical protein
MFQENGTMPLCSRVSYFDPASTKHKNRHCRIIFHWHGEQVSQYRLFIIHIYSLQRKEKGEARFRSHFGRSHIVQLGASRSTTASNSLTNAQRPRRTDPDSQPNFVTKRWTTSVAELLPRVLVSDVAVVMVISSSYNITPGYIGVNKKIKIVFVFKYATSSVTRHPLLFTCVTITHSDGVILFN